MDVAKAVSPQYSTASQVNPQNSFWKEEIDNFLEPMPTALKMEQLRQKYFGNFYEQSSLKLSSLSPESDRKWEPARCRNGLVRRSDAGPSFAGSMTLLHHE